MLQNRYSLKAEFGYLLEVKKQNVVNTFSNLFQTRGREIRHAPFPRAFLYGEELSLLGGLPSLPSHPTR